MTTIAWDGDILASDSLSTSGNTKLSGEVKKVFRVGKYRVAFSGDFAPANYFYTYNLKHKLSTGDYKFLPEITSNIEDDFTIMVIEDDKKYCMIYNSYTGYWDEFNAPVALGSGSKFALGAMYTGFNAIKSIEVACKLDTHSGLPIFICE